ncbi:MFS transporter [Streptomyces longispororuber]|uniref:MFS transporter n=1 Tax=Streptomyces longispororuber TaxID=68230 RepID=UPI00210CF56B|nr:MFS transporter [Streptomyces longispororuber]MCQ4207373.1 MFS transporter [Streptomyces longispororuber]
MADLDSAIRPPKTRHGRFVTAIVIDSIGTGVFIPVSMLYFLATTSLTLVQVGAALTAAGLLALPAGPLAGGLVDRYGAKPVLQAANLAQALGFAGYLVVGQTWQIVVCAWLNSAGRAVFFGCYGVTVTALAAPGQRERWFGLLGSVRNLGYALGGLLSAVAVGIGTDGAYATIVALNALSYVAAFTLLRSVPNARPAAGHDPVGGWRRVLRDRRYLPVVAHQLCFAISLFALNIAIPVYAVDVLGLPGWTAGAVFTLNTLMVGFGQGIVIGRLRGRVRSRVLVAGHVCFATGYVLFLAADGVSALTLAVTVVLLGAASYTLGEILGSPVTSTIAAESAPEALRGRYLALNQLAVTVAGAVAPIALSGLLSAGAPAIWLTLVGVGALGAALATVIGRTVPAARSRIGEV